MFKISSYTDIYNTANKICIDHLTYNIIEKLPKYKSVNWLNNVNWWQVDADYINNLNNVCSGYVFGFNKYDM